MVITGQDGRPAEERRQPAAPQPLRRPASPPAVSSYVASRHQQIHQACDELARCPCFRPSRTYQTEGTPDKEHQPQKKKKDSVFRQAVETVPSPQQATQRHNQNLYQRSSQGTRFGTCRSSTEKGCPDVDGTLGSGMQSGTRPVPDQILQLYQLTSPPHCPCRTATTFQTRIPG